MTADRNAVVGVIELPEGTPETCDKCGPTVPAKYGLLIGHTEDPGLLTLCAHDAHPLIRQFRDEQREPA
jgi:hypothetical protein